MEFLPGTDNTGGPKKSRRIPARKNTVPVIFGYQARVLTQTVFHEGGV